MKDAMRKCLHAAPFSLALLFTQAQAAEPNKASVELQSAITMTLTASQSGGGCSPGYAWHAQYGGCRRAQAEQTTETAACPAGLVGQQTRLNTRYRYIAQTDGNVLSDPWKFGEWNTGDCTPPVDCNEVRPDSWTADMEMDWRPNADGSFALRFGSIGDDYWHEPTYGGVHDNSLTFNLIDPGAIAQFSLNSVYYDDWVYIAVNGHHIYNGPHGGDRLELQLDNVWCTALASQDLCFATQQECLNGLALYSISNGKCSNMDRPWHNSYVKYSASGTGQAELRISWSYTQPIDLKKYLTPGRNTIFIRTIVGGGGEVTTNFTGRYATTCAL